MTGRGLAALLLATAGCVHAQSVTPSPSRTSAPSPANLEALRHTLDSLADAHHGVVGYFVKDIDHNASIGRRQDETFSTASLIKVPILVTVFDLVEKGQLSLDDQLTLLKIDKVPGSGTLQFMHDGMILTVRDAAWLMSTISDNTATNLLLDRIAIRRVWEKMESLGLMHTKVHSKSFLRLTSVAMDSSVKYGLGVTTPAEMARLFELMASGKAVSARSDSMMLDILAHNEDETLLQRSAGGVRAAHKTGATDAVRTECSLFYLTARVVACVLTKENADQRWILDSEPQVLMARMGEAIVNAWGAPPKQ